MNDKSLKVIYNATAYEQEKDERIKSLLHFICTNEPGEDDFSQRLSDMVEKIKENEIFRSDYAAMNLHDRDLIRNTKEETSIEAAIMLLKESIAPEIIAKCEKLPLEKVMELKKELENK